VIRTLVIVIAMSLGSLDASADSSADPMNLASFRGRRDISVEVVALPSSMLTYAPIPPAEFKARTVTDPDVYRVATGYEMVAKSLVAALMSEPLTPLPEDVRFGISCFIRLSVPGGESREYYFDSTGDVIVGGKRFCPRDGFRWWNAIWEAIGARTSFGPRHFTGYSCDPKAE
jgi:hypothetical protein